MVSDYYSALYNIIKHYKLRSEVLYSCDLRLKFLVEATLVPTVMHGFPWLPQSPGHDISVLEIFSLDFRLVRVWQQRQRQQQHREKAPLLLFLLAATAATTTMTTTTPLMLPLLPLLLLSLIVALPSAFLVYGSATALDTETDLCAARTGLEPTSTSWILTNRIGQRYVQAMTVFGFCDVGLYGYVLSVD